MLEQTPAAPGLKWRRRKHGPPAAYWVARSDLVAKGFRPSTARIHYDPADPDHMLHIASRCKVLNGQMLTFSDLPSTRGKVAFNGTIKSLIELYMHDAESPYHRLKAASKRPYNHYAKQIIETIGTRLVAQCDGRDVQRWFNGWKGDDPDRPMLAKAQTCLALLKSALGFGVMCKHKACGELREIIRVMRFQTPPPRRVAPTRDQIIAIRRAAHAAGHPGIALASAMQFESMQRQWDVIGQWIPIDDPIPSAVLSGREKWIGPQWSDIQPGMILKWEPTKTSRTTGVRVEVDLTMCPMVLEEMAGIPEESRRGPIVKHPDGEPYLLDRYQRLFRKIARAAGVPDTVWSRDIRAGGITDARKSGAALEDASKAAGHSDTRTTARIYDRDTLEAHRRVAAARTKNNP